MTNVLSHFYITLSDSSAFSATKKLSKSKGGRQFWPGVELMQKAFTDCDSDYLSAVDNAWPDDGQGCLLIATSVCVWCQ